MIFSLIKNLQFWVKSVSVASQIHYAHCQIKVKLPYLSLKIGVQKTQHMRLLPLNSQNLFSEIKYSTLHLLVFGFPREAHFVTIGICFAEK